MIFLWFALSTITYVKLYVKRTLDILNHFFKSLQFELAIDYGNKVLDTCSDSYVKANARCAIGVCYNQMSVNGKKHLGKFALSSNLLIPINNVSFLLNSTLIGKTGSW